MKRETCLAFLAVVLAGGSSAPAGKKAAESQPAGPSDVMIHAYLSRLARQIDAELDAALPKADDWPATRDRWKQEYLYMLGLSPMPQRTPLNPIITGTLQRNGYVVDNLYFESQPRLYVTANLYRPANVPAGAKLPAVLYVCGHGNRGPEGVKVGYQANPIWFAKHGYICLVVDTVERGEIKGVHRGLYSEGRRWWLSRGYTPAGVECWNGIRGLDYLVSRPDVDADRLAVTGISGGGASTFWIAAADERVKAAVPVSGLSDLGHYVVNNGVDGHCDCMFMPNTFAWPWTRIAALVAPRALMFIDSDQDPLFPADGHERVIRRLERLYKSLGANDKLDSLLSVGDHAYRKDIRQAAYRFINLHLKNDPAVVTDSEEDLVTDKRDLQTCPIPPKDLCVFPDGKGLPTDSVNATIDERFVPMAKVDPPTTGEFDTWKGKLLSELRRVPFRALPARVAPAVKIAGVSPDVFRVGSEEGIEYRLASRSVSNHGKSVPLVLLVDLENKANAHAWLAPLVDAASCIYACHPRGVGDLQWNTKSPPNRVEREFALVGRTVDEGRLLDVIAAARHMRKHTRMSILVAGEGAAGALAAYAAVLEPDIAGAIVKDPPASHMDPAAPQFLSVLRVCDVPEAMGLISPKQLTVVGGKDELVSKVKAAYTAAGATNLLTVR